MRYTTEKAANFTKRMKGVRRANTTRIIKSLEYMLLTELKEVIKRRNIITSKSPVNI